MIRGAWWAAGPALAAAAYYLVVLIAALRWQYGARRNLGPAATLPPVSLLKPMNGSDPRLYEALRSHALQDYPAFEMLFGVSDPHDPALVDITRLQTEFPALPIRVMYVKTEAPNPKAFVLGQLARSARYPLLVINDDDIVVEPGYLRSVTRPLRDRKTGLVTCLYRAHASSQPGRMEALGIATEFAPSVVAARFLGVVEFALGATMALRAETLREIGGFEPIAEYLADDYQLGRRVAEAGYRVEFAPDIVETGLGSASWGEAWRHQLRWSRTIRVSRTGGYYGSLVTQATLWALVAFAGRQWWAGGAALGLRMLSGWFVGAAVLEDHNVTRRMWLVPARDLFGFLIWVSGCFGSTVYWRGRKLRLGRDGRVETKTEYLAYSATSKS